MKRNWEYKKLGDVSTVVGGSTPKTNIPEYWGGGNYWVTPAELTGDKYIESTERTITDEAVAKTNLTLLPVGTVLLSSRAPIGKVCITRSPMYCNQGFKNIVCSKCLLNEYVYWWLKGKTDYLNSLGVGATFKEISKRAVEQIVIPVPSLSEQSRIVAELDLLTGIIDKQNAQLKELDNLAQAIFYDMFGDPIENPKGWEVKLWGDLFDTILGKMLDAKKQNPNDTIRSYLGNTNVQWFSFDLTTLKTMTFSAKEMEKFALRKGDILLCEGGESGRCAVWEDDNSLVLFQKAIHRARVKDKALIDSHFIPFVIKLMREMGGLKNFVSKATIEHLTGEKLAQVPIILPPLALQRSFAEKIQSVEKQKETIRASIADTQKLLDYTMDKYFG